MAVVVLTSPFLGGIADFGRIRKRLLFVYTLMCVSAVASFSFIRKGMVFEGFLLMVIANIGMEGGLVFYNSFLPEITEKNYQGRVSAWGYAVGYAGSILSLIIALPLINKGSFGTVWLMVAVFFAIFSIPAFLFLPQDTKRRITISQRDTKNNEKNPPLPPFDKGGRGGDFCKGAIEGFKYTWSTFKEIWAKRESRKFLIAYLIYEDGVNTVIVFSSIFAATTLGFKPVELIFLYLIVQITALIGSFIMAKPIDYRGPKKVVTLSLLMWSAVSILAFFVHTKEGFWVIGCIAGLGLGTVQAATRAFFTQFIPPGCESEYFGVYSMVGKSSAIVGPLVFGYISSTYGSQRPAILSVALFFLTGLIIMQFVKGGGPNIKADS